MDPGMLRGLIEIRKSAGYTEDSIGNQIPKEETYYRCRAYINSLSGKEYWEAAMVQAEETVVFTVRYCGKIAVMDTRGYSIAWNGCTYNIKSIDNVMNRNDAVKIRAERKNDGKN